MSNSTMVDVTIHYRGATQERRRLAAVPVVGGYLRQAGRLWQVSAVVVDGAAVDVFLLEVSARLVGELQGAWAAWGEPIAAIDDAPRQREFRTGA
jgi:hypothetical protein